MRIKFALLKKKRAKILKMTNFASKLVKIKESKLTIIAECSKFSRV